MKKKKGAGREEGGEKGEGEGKTEEGADLLNAVS